MRFFTSSNFWSGYKTLPPHIQKIADKNFALFKTNSFHPSLHFKKVGRYHSIRIGRSYRAIAVETSDGLVWFWIGAHDEYKRIIKSLD